jgi:trans-feruloyl-CoA hydratase/vanillin synthase
MAIADGKTYQTVRVEREGNGITWVILNRPEKRNAMNPTMHFEMVDVLDSLADDPETHVLVLTGAGDSWCAGQDLNEFFRALDGKPAEQRRSGAGGGCSRFPSRPSRWSTASASAAPSRRWSRAISPSPRKMRPLV